MPPIDKALMRRWIEAVAHGFNKSVGDISYIFCNDEKILEVNRQYLNHDYFTDIITFDYSRPHRISGDMFISLDINGSQVRSGILPGWCIVRQDCILRRRKRRSG